MNSFGRLVALALVALLPAITGCSVANVVTILDGSFGGGSGARAVDYDAQQQDWEQRAAADRY